jgi:hypothetical protein
METAEFLPGVVLARTRLHHSNEARFRASLPFDCGLVRLEAGPVIVCFLARGAMPGDAVQVRLRRDDLLEAGAHPAAAEGRGCGLAERSL